MDEVHKKVWEKEHAAQTTFTAMHTMQPSPCMPGYVEFLKNSGIVPEQSIVVDLGCGKGRNSIYLASQGFTVWANDFSEKAVEDARGRSQMYLSQIEYQVVDLTNPWPYNYETVDAIFDCETTIYIPEEGRTAAIQSAFKTLKKGGYYFFYGIAEHTSHKDMSHTQQGYTEKRYTMEELTMAYSAFDVVSIETLEHHDHINGHDAIHTMWTAVFQKPLN